MMEHRESSSSLLREQLLELAKLPENAACADCQEPSPQWASVNLGIFICIGCAGIHRNLSTSVSRVKSVMLDTWKPDEVQTVAAMGNEKSNALWEGDLPPLFVHPSAIDSVPFKEQWIKAKYLRKAYAKKDGGSGSSSGKDIAASPYAINEGLPCIEGWLTKKGEVVKNWKRRYFRLQGTLLSYYKKTNAEPAGQVCLSGGSKAYSSAEAPILDHPNCFVIAVPGRDYIISADTGEAMYDWVSTLKTSWNYLCRPASVGYTAKATPEKHIPELLAELNSKTIPSHKRKINGKVLSGCFLGCQAVDYIVRRFLLESRQEAVLLGQELINKGHIKSPTGEPFQDLHAVFQFSAES